MWRRGNGLCIKAYPYEFKIDSKLRLAAIDGIEIADTNEDTVSREEYDGLLARIEELENSNTLEKKKIKSGSVTFGEIIHWTSVEKQIKFDQPLESDNYSVVFTCAGFAGGWPDVTFGVFSKTANGFTAVAYCAAEQGIGKTGNIVANWILSMNE